MKVLQVLIYLFQYLVVVPMALIVVGIVLLLTSTRFWGGYVVGNMVVDSGLFRPWTILPPDHPPPG